MTVGNYHSPHNHLDRMIEKRNIEPLKFDTPSGDGFLQEDLKPVKTPDVDPTGKGRKIIKRKKRRTLFKQMAINLIREIPYVRSVAEPLIKSRTIMAKTKEKLPQKKVISAILTALALALGFFGFNIDPELAVLHIESVYVAVTALVSAATAAGVGLYEMFSKKES